MATLRNAGADMPGRSFDKRCVMTSAQITPVVMVPHRASLVRDDGGGLFAGHCERSEAIHGTSAMKMDCFAALAMTGVARAGKHTQPSFPDVQLHIVDAPLGAGPESITTDGGYGFRARCCASPRNDRLGLSCFCY